MKVKNLHSYVWAFCLSFSLNPSLYAQISGCNVNGGTIQTTTGATSVSVCSGDNLDDLVTFTSSGASASKYAYVLVNEKNMVLGVLTGTINFEGSPTEQCRVFGIAYTGSLLLKRGDNILTSTLSDDCASMTANSVTINIQDAANCRAEIEQPCTIQAGNIATTTSATTVTICSGDNIDDLVTFTKTSTANSKFVYVLVNENGIILGFITTGTINFEGSPAEQCRVYGIAYTGNLLLKRGDHISTSTISDGCSGTADNFVAINIQDATTCAVAPPQPNCAAVNAAEVSTSTNASSIIICSGDNIDDFVTFTNNSTSDSKYAYFLVSDNDYVLGEVIGKINFEGSPAHNYRIYGVAYTGNLLLSNGDHILSSPVSDGCADISDFYFPLTIQDAATCATQANCTENAGDIFTSLGATSVAVCSGDKIDDLVTFTNNHTSASKYTYVLVNDQGVVLDFLTGTINFEGSPAEQCRVYGIAYTGNLLLKRGDPITTNVIADGCADITDNFVAIDIKDTKTCGKQDDQRIGNYTSNEHDLKAYPNPVKETINISLGNFIGQEGQLSLLNQAGQVVKQLKIAEIASNSVSMNIGELETGFYLLQINIAGQLTNTLKIVKSK